MQRSKRHVFAATAMLTLFSAALAQAAVPWWEAPVLKGASVASPAGGGTHYINMDETGTYMICGTGFKVTDAYPLFRVADLNSASGSYTSAPVWSVTGQDDAWTNGLRGGAISYKLKRVLSGAAGGVYKDWNVSFPIALPHVRDSTVFAIYNDSGIVFDSCDFSPDGEYLYSNFYGAQPNKIWKWNVLNGLATSGTNLTAAASFASTNIVQIRSLNVYQIGGKDLIFYGEGGSANGKVCVYDFATTNETLLVTASVPKTIMNVKVSGIGSSQMHLHIETDDGAVQIFKLAADGLSTGAQVASFTRTQMAAIIGTLATNVRGYEVSNDERFAYIDDHGNTVRMIWTLPKPTTLLTLQ